VRQMRTTSWPHRDSLIPPGLLCANNMNCETRDVLQRRKGYNATGNGLLGPKTTQNHSEDL